MVAPVGLSLVVQSLPAIQTLANAEAAGAETQRSIMSPLIQQEIIKEQEKIEELKRKDPSTKVTDEKEGEAEQQASGKRRRPEDEDKPPPPETTSSNSSPLAGNLVSVKV